MELVTVFAVYDYAAEPLYRKPQGVYTEAALAVSKCASRPKENRAGILEEKCIKTSDGNYWELPNILVQIDDSKERVLAALSATERAVLGI